MKLWLFLLLFFFGPGLRLSAEPLVLVDAVSILKSAESGNNQEGMLLQQVLAHYPDSVLTESLSRNRAREWIKTAPNGCIPWLKKNAEREQYYLFTLPYMVENAIQLVMMKNSRWHHQLQAMQDSDKLSLDQLLQMEDGPLLGVESNRTYGEQIDQLLQQHRNSRALYTRTSSSEDMGSMLPMLERGFIDGLLEYRRIAGRMSSEFIYYQLNEAEPLNLVYFACSKGDKGQAVVAGLNQAIRQVSQQAAYQALALQGFLPAEHARVLQHWLAQIQSE